MVDISFYVMKLKEHEELRLSTNERNKFWREYKWLDLKELAKIVDMIVIAMRQIAKNVTTMFVLSAIVKYQ